MFSLKAACELKDSRGSIEELLILSIYSETPAWFLNEIHSSIFFTAYPVAAPREVQPIPAGREAGPHPGLVPSQSQGPHVETDKYSH